MMNSYTGGYKEINAGDITYLVGSDSKEAKMGAITTKSMGVHVVGMFFFKASAAQVGQLLGLLEKNLSGKVFARYAVITPETANIPQDVLRAIPVQSIENGPTGAKPKDLWGQIVSHVTNLAVSAVNFIVNTVVAVGNFIVHAADVIQHYALALWNTAVSVVRSSVNTISKIVNEIKEIALSILKAAILKVIKPLIDAYVEYRNGLSKASLKIISDYAMNGKISESDIELLNEAILQPFFYGIMGLGMVIWGAILIVQGMSMGTTVFIGGLVTIAMMAVLENVFHSEDKKGISLPVVGLGLQVIIDEVEKILGKKKVERFLFSLDEALISVVGFILGLPAVSEAAKDKTGTGAALYSYGVSFVSLVIAFGASAMELENHQAALGVGSIAVALAIEGVALGTVGLLDKGILANKVLSGIGLGVSALSVYLFFEL